MFLRLVLMLLRLCSVPVPVPVSVPSSRRRSPRTRSSRRKTAARAFWRHAIRWPKVAQDGPRLPPGRKNTCAFGDMQRGYGPRWPKLAQDGPRWLRAIRGLHVLDCVDFMNGHHGRDCMHITDGVERMECACGSNDNHSSGATRWWW